MKHLRTSILTIGICLMLSSNILAQKGWYKIETGETVSFIDLYFANQDTGYVLGLSNRSEGGNILLHTIDGGKNWKKLIDIDRSGKQSDNLLSTIGFWNDSTGFISGVYAFATGQNDMSLILGTKNSGKTWSGDTGIIGREYCGASTILQNGVGFITTSWDNWASDPLGKGGGQILKTTDFGASWNHIGYAYYIFNDRQDILSMDFDDSEKGMILVKDQNLSYVHLLKTTDGGSTWGGSDALTNTIPDFQHSRVIKHINDKWLLGTDSNIYLSPDLGDSWKIVKSNTFAVGSFSFYKNSIGYSVPGVFFDWFYAFVPASGFLYKTLDSGKRWFPQLKIDSLNYLYKVFAVNDSVAYAVGANGLVLKTIDGGGPSLAEVKNESKRNTTFSVSPEPAYGGCSLTFDPENTTRTLRLYNVLGQEVFSSNIPAESSSYILERYNLLAGTYYCLLGNQIQKIVFQ